MIFIVCKEKDKILQKIKLYGNIKYKYMDNFCNLSEYNDENNILILYNINVNKRGIIKKYDYVLEEVFITLPINLVITNKCNNKIKEICKFYKIPLLKI